MSFNFLSIHIAFGGGAFFATIPVSVVIFAVVAYIVSEALTAIPVEHRKNITPQQAWLLLIPVFHAVWNFIVFARLAESFKSYFEANGRPQPGDYGKGLGLAFSILFACSFIPCAICLTGLPTIIVLVLLMIKVSELKALIVNGGGGAFPLQ